MKKESYIRSWLHDAFGIMEHELKQIFSDGGVLLIFFVACLVYPLLYNLIYYNGILDDTPVAVVDMADCAQSRRFAREVDATRECEVVYRCKDMEEARKLLEERKINGIVYFPEDFGEKLAAKEVTSVGVYCDMSSFLYYKNALMAVNHVMLDELGTIQVERYSEAGFTDQEISQLVEPIRYEGANPFNNAFSYSYFLISVILFIIIQQTMFYGMSIIAGTMREHNRSFASLPDRLAGHGVGRVLIGRGGAYWLIYMAVGIYISFIVPAIFGIPQRGNFWDVMTVLLFYITDCVYFCMAWSSCITRRESVFILFLCFSPICVFFPGSSWPAAAFPGFWKVFSRIFPCTFGCRAFINVSTAGGELAAANAELIAMIIQIAVYYFLSYVAIYAENWVIHHKAALKEKRDDLERRTGLKKDDDLEIIAGEGEV